MEPKIYEGMRHPDEKFGWSESIVTVNGNVLHPTHGVCDYHTWGYPGGGPALLAEAILFDLLNDVEMAQALAQEFLEKFVQNWSQHDAWRITGDEIRLWLGDLEGDAVPRGTDVCRCLDTREDHAEGPCRFAYLPSPLDGRMVKNCGCSEFRFMFVQRTR
jgi:hypothetical protein